MAVKPKKDEYKQVSVSEFFEKNRHILGFDSAQKSLFMIVKEAVDNSLDACEERGILPEISVRIERKPNDIFRITVEDNGPGIERTIVPRVFGQLLYGSRFHVLRQTRGQQGLGITASILYGQSTSGEPCEIITKRAQDEVAFHFILGIDVRTNTADLKVEEPVIWDRESGTSIAITAKGRYVTGKQSIMEYLKEVAVVNPNARIHFTDPDGKSLVFERSIEEPAKPSKATKPHPYGIELGELLSLSQITESTTLLKMLSSEFSRLSDNSASEILAKAGIDPEMNPRDLAKDGANAIMEAIANTKLMPPTAESLSPISEQFIRLGMLSVYGEERPSFFGKPVSGKVRIYKGNPFSVEVGMVYGGDLPSEQPVRIVRYANKVPLLFQPGSCAITQAVSDIDWRQLGFDQKQGKGVPYGPAIILVHVHGPRIPYISESKEAIAPIEEIMDEIRNVIRIEVRQLRKFNSRAERNKKIGEKFNLVSVVVPEIAKKSAEILSMEIPDCKMVISRIANVVFVREDIAGENGRKTSRTSVVNYTMENISMNLKIVYPFGEKDLEIRDLPPSESFTYDQDLDKIAGGYSGAEFYFTGINPVYVQGAEELPADWGLKGVETVEE
ncbi:MAG: DNA topoisomerase VI subunit B [Candidatus Thermoplasmatota archaeon]|jgi:DNA topoisomerase-6 subunit B|nr:DNA topoisomerase VI subunit B [Candidatus Thermoplasmatota archaeon]MCL5790955.1 DNA topoisomerase VI subunit B [Candidatus Thermoplasmatota archaeon]